jgi:hypothetical protein
MLCTVNPWEFLTKELERSWQSDIPCCTSEVNTLAFLLGWVWICGKMKIMLKSILLTSIIAADVLLGARRNRSSAKHAAPYHQPPT